MSLFGALQTGVAGLDAQSSALAVTSANIANVNTVGYKTGQASFETLLADSMEDGDIGEAGVMETSTQNVTQQGLINSTNVATNMAISGNGFFVVSPSSSTSTAQALLYTRAGNFTPDADGNLQNAAGLYLMGWPVDANGDVPTDRNDLIPINVNALSGTSEPTTTMSLQANLQASTTAVSGYAAGDMSLPTTDANFVAPDFQRTISVFDSQGGQQPLQINYVKTGPDAWAYEIDYQGASANLTGTTNNVLASGTINFNADGTLKSLVSSDGSSTINGGSVSLSIPWSAGSGLVSQPITLNMGTIGTSSGVTQFDSPSALASSNVDGALFGSLTNVSIDSSGYVTANFSNGLSQKIYKIPLATFTNPDGLTEVSGNAYQQSETSGTATVNEANVGGAGSINSSSLENSTVDLATEFTNLITTQRAYQASAQIITTASNMLDTLMQQLH